jgi:hypothetical protein
MKIPRDALLARHIKAEPKLDQIRRELVAGLASKRERSEAAGAGAWLEWWWPLRWHGAAWATAWLVIVLLRAGEPATSQPVTAHGSSFSVRQLEQAFLENRRHFQEPGEIPVVVPSPAPLPTVPPRRSDRQTLNPMV